MVECVNSLFVQTYEQLLQCVVVVSGLKSNNEKKMLLMQKVDKGIL